MIRSTLVNTQTDTQKDTFSLLILLAQPVELQMTDKLRPFKIKM